jgi:hypothetical protein
MRPYPFIIPLVCMSVACAPKPELPPLIVSPAERALLGCYRVSIATKTPGLPAEFAIRLDSAEGLNGRQVRALTELPDSVQGLGFFWSMVGDSLHIRSWAGREGQGVRINAIGTRDTLVGTATWYLRFDRSDRDSAPAMLGRRPCD